ncbi:hypothetical protein B0T16DRAFT_78164 [Cercophora newfieldiana]|uniref:Uncharacterized protein n=1 Tax=Cercophora newfieldiana TaxID=92897 RepID=A0AA39YEX9_9PEZI|nr:hypothetical protein B0T16DRAFT_78164 [Cercophora newfieldiana]
MPTSRKRGRDSRHESLRQPAAASSRSLSAKAAWNWQTEDAWKMEAHFAQRCSPHMLLAPISTSHRRGAVAHRARMSRARLMVERATARHNKKQSIYGAQMQAASHGCDSVSNRIMSLRNPSNGRTARRNEGLLGSYLQGGGSQSEGCARPCQPCQGPPLNCRQWKKRAGRQRESRKSQLEAPLNPRHGTDVR